MADEQDVTKNRSWMTPTTVALLSPLSIHPLLLFFRHRGKVSWPSPIRASRRA